nr:MAG TPA: toxin [Caudoviricetes sp.]
MTGFFSCEGDWECYAMLIVTYSGIAVVVDS